MAIGGGAQTLKYLDISFHANLDYFLNSHFVAITFIVKSGG